MIDNDHDTITIGKPKNADSRWMTIDVDGNIISEGKTPDEAISLAKKKTENYTVIFVPKEGSTYIF